MALRRGRRARKDLVSHRVAVANQLRAHLRNVFPGAAGLFADLDSPASLTFLARFDTQDRADWLTPARLGKWLASIGYSGHTDPAEMHARRASPWADDLHQRARGRGHDHPHAVRILARAWLFVIWHCWQDGVPYDPARHRALHTCSTKINRRQLDTGLLMPGRRCSHDWPRSPAPP